MGAVCNRTCGFATDVLVLNVLARRTADNMVWEGRMEGRFTI